MTKKELLKKYDNIGDFHEGRAWVELNNKWGCIDLDGKTVTSVKYDKVGIFQEGRAWVEINNYKFEMIK